MLTPGMLETSREHPVATVVIFIIAMIISIALFLVFG